jgi:hypothetical protein
LELQRHAAAERVAKVGEQDREGCKRARHASRWDTEILGFLRRMEFTVGTQWHRSPNLSHKR